MASIGLDQFAITNWRAEVRQAMKDALRNPWVAAVAIFAALLLSLAVVGGMVWLLWAERDARMLLDLVQVVLYVVLFKRVSDVDGRVRTVETQTNGNTRRLMDAALKDKG